MDLNTLLYIESVLLESLGRRDSISVALEIVRARIAEIQGRTSMSTTEVAALIAQNTQLQAQVAQLQQEIADLKTKVPK